MSNLLRAWYVFLGLGFLTFMFTAFTGQVPYRLSSVIALPHQLFFSLATNIRETTKSMVERRNVREENQALQQRVDNLLTEKRALEIEVERLEQLLRVRETQSPAALLTAPVIATSSSPILRQLTIGRGSKHGVMPNMPVTVPAGLVGLVTDVTGNSSSVRTITEPLSKIGISVRDKGGQGIAVGEIGGKVRVINFIEDDPVEIGDLVETNSRGGLFPRGLLLGTVTEAPVRNPNDLRIEFLLEPAVDVMTLQEVTVLETQ
jgi:rod shape-determining protein MreC